MKTPDNSSAEQALRFAQLEIRMLREQLAKVKDDAKALGGEGLKTGPKTSASSADAERKETPNDHKTITGAFANQRRILCVEDSEANFRLIEAILEDRPESHLAWADTGQKGVELALAQPPQMILLDLDLPDMHGSEVLRQLRAQPATAGLPVIIISADATSQQIERMLAAGARDYLVKPFEVRRFLLMHDEILQEA